MNKAIKNLDQFMDRFPNYSFLESRDGCTRLSNGEDADSDYASAWFNDDSELLVTNPDLY